MNYAALVTAIEDMVENFDTTFVSNIPIFVQNAEKKIYNMVDLPVNQAVTAPTITMGSRSVTAPADFLSVFNFSLTVSGSNVNLLNKDPEFITEAYPDATITGVPKYYAILNETTLYLGPTPAAAYTASLEYFRYPTSIVTAGTTWLGNNYDQVLLYGAVIEAYTFMKGSPDMLKQYTDMFNGHLKPLMEYAATKVPSDRFRSGRRM